jgi:LCP family protein required for cell wall assembly
MKQAQLLQHPLKMLKTALFRLLLASLVLSACSGMASQALGTPTPTPFLPGGSVAALPDDQPSVALPIPEEGFGEFAPPGEASDIEIPPPMGKLPQPDGQINILVLGSDQRPNDGGFRTDVIELVTLNTRDNSVSLTSFPRDLYVYHPGWRMVRINAGMAHGGFDQLAQTFAYNFGVLPDHYVQINFSGFERLVDTLGGVDVQVGQGLTDEREGPGDFSVAAGLVHMDGETALWYVRSRGTSSDFARTVRQQEVLTAIFRKLLSLNALANAPQIYDQYKQMVTTDMQLTDMLPLIGLATAIGNNNSIHRYSIGPNEVDSWTTSSGGAVLLPKQDVVRAIMMQALSSPNS